MSQVRAFRLLGETQLRECKARAEQVFATWEQAWLPRVTEVRLDCLRAGRSDLALAGSGGERAVLLEPKEGDGWLLVLSDEGFELALARLLAGTGDVVTGAEPMGEVEKDLLARARDDLLKSLARAWGSGEAVTPNWDPDRWADRVRSAAGAGSGSLVLVVALGQAHLRILLGPALVQRPRSASRTHAKSARSLSSCLDAIRGRTMQVQVSAGSVALTIGELRSLKAGDILRLNQSIRDPLSLQTATARPIGHAHLGKSGGVRAVQVVG